MLARETPPLQTPPGSSDTPVVRQGRKREGNQPESKARTTHPQPPHHGFSIYQTVRWPEKWGYRIQAKKITVSRNPPHRPHPRRAPATLGGVGEKEAERRPNSRRKKTQVQPHSSSPIYIPQTVF
ncbi:unnamed protein product [Cuscuta europaea]|uniref:Uncharacterized protein n=1 Tax=Cuscuta europaea TaxID=41803 RepID=A0A9P0ZH66_CUSEU|nr:unnamed protein product [Cuscuta europaea]